MDRNTVYSVMNRSGSTVVYSIPEMNLRRQYAAGETKRITGEELEKLTYQPGGATLIAEYLLIKDKQLLDELNIHTELEYDMTAADVKTLLQTGSLDAFLDALDFAPDGVIQLIKDLSVELPLNDVQKRAALKEKTGFDVDRAVANAAADKADDKIEPVHQGRRVQPASSEEPTRREKYTVVNRSSEE